MNKPFQVLVALLTIIAYISIGVYLIGIKGFEVLSYANAIFLVGFFALSLFSLAYIQSKTETVISITSIIKNYFTYIALIILTFAVVYVTTVLSTSPFSTMLISAIIYIGLLIASLYGVYNLIKNTTWFKSSNENPYVELLTHLLFIIPCSIVDTGRKLANDIVTTPRYIYTILALEALFLAGYVGLPKLWNAIRGISYDVLLGGNSIPLTREKTVGTIGENYHNGVAFSFFAENVPASSLEGNSFLPILRVGEKTMTVSYNPSVEQLRISILKPDGTTIDTIEIPSSVPLQKWNKVVINRAGSSLDVFVNGEMVYTGTHDLNVLYKNNILVGRENGLHGGIRNVYVERYAPFSHSFIKAY